MPVTAPISSTVTPPTPAIQCTDPSGQTTLCSTRYDDFASTAARTVLRTVVAVVWMQQRHVHVERAVKSRPACNPNSASNRASHTVSPVDMSQRHVPNPPASNAARKCSVRSRVRCSAMRRSVTSSDDPTMPSTVPSCVENRPSRRVNPDRRPVAADDHTIAVFAFPARRRPGHRVRRQRLGRSEHLQHRAPGHFVLGPAEQPLRLSRPQHDSAVRIGHHTALGSASMTSRSLSGAAGSVGSPALTRRTRFPCRSYRSPDGAAERTVRRWTQTLPRTSLPPEVTGPAHSRTSAGRPGA